MYELLLGRLLRAALLSAAVRPGAVRYLPARWTLSEGPDGRSALRAA